MKRFLKFSVMFIAGVSILFIIDLVCIFSIDRPILAIKKDNYSFKGVLYDTYNCVEYSKPQIVAKGTKFSCVEKVAAENKKSNFMPTTFKNISGRVSNISSKGAVVIIKDANEKQNIYGEWYVIEKEIDGEWYEIKPSIKGNYGFTSLGYIVDENKEVKFDIDWEWLYGKLPNGKYRILKKVEDGYISIPFNIASNSMIEVVKNDSDMTKFNDYLKIDNRTVFLANNLENVYYSNMNLKNYLKVTNEPLDDNLKNLTDLLKKSDTLKDGGTSIFKSKENDITVIICNTLDGNRDVYIGDYALNFNNICK